MLSQFADDTNTLFGSVSVAKVTKIPNPGAYTIAHLSKTLDTTYDSDD